MNLKRKRNLTIKQRFDSKYIVNENDCWIWQDTLKTTFGYGILRVNGKSIRATHISLHLHKGITVPTGHCVCHICDVKSCVNPDHLFVGTQKDNMSDMAQKKRSLIGERNPNAKLNSTMVSLIREASKEGFSIASISRYFKIGAATIGKIARHKNWIHV